MLRLDGAAALAGWRRGPAAAGRVGFVPTMGALHAGHGALVERAAAECDAVLVSVFVNPLQFDEASDFERYPRVADQDCRLLEGWGASAAYLPAHRDVYPEGAPRQLEPGPGGRLYEGLHRPGHFAGMLTVVHRLFEQVRPQRAYFGQKDAQQLFLVRELARGLSWPLEVVACDTVREADGLALSSRNRHLSADDRPQAATLHRALLQAQRDFASGQRDPAALEAAMRRVYAEAGVEVEYAAVVDDATFLPPSARSGRWRAVTAARVGGTRLIDNLALGAC
ncbi:MAG: pantoate--beta-alanine ligase [Planctomycetes bacterium]|nr:pantoate--beta-alanine ligase [Planctomycetota bacterium]MBL7008383.1 pantoate--beta-alanine ligase [Planctomycetota bacterium]